MNGVSLCRTSGREPGLPDVVCCAIDLAGAIVSDVSGLGLDQDTDCMVWGLVGDVNGDSFTNPTDKAFVAYKNGHPVLPDNIRFDLNLDGLINPTDKARLRFGTASRRLARRFHAGAVSLLTLGGLAMRRRRRYTDRSP